MEIVVSPMKLSDLEQIADHLTSEFDDFWTVTTLQAELKNPNSYYFVAKQNEQIVGFAGIWNAVDQMHIMNIVTKVDQRHKGIGSKLLDFLIAFCQNLKVESLTLEVNEKNENAINLYEKYNFKKIGLRKNYYSQNENAIIMTYYY